MIFKKIDEKTRVLAYSMFVLAIAGVALISSGIFNGATEASSSSTPFTAMPLAPEATFAGSGVGSIPDGGSSCSPHPVLTET